MPSEVSHYFSIRFRPEEREILERRAAGRPIAGYIREALNFDPAPTKIFKPILLT